MKKNILTPTMIAIALVCGGAFSSCAAQPPPPPEFPNPVAMAAQQIAQNQPVPAPVVPSQIPPTTPRVPAPSVQPKPSQPPPDGGAQPPSVSTPQTPLPPAAPERRLLPSPAAPAPPGGMISLNFTRADLVEIIHIIAQHLRLTYTIDPEVKGTVTINSAEPLKSEDLLPIFHQVLRMNGAVAVRSGNLYRIIPIKDGKSIARPVGQSREDSFALQIVPVRFFTVAEMKRLLTPFLMPGGEIIDNPRGNFLIVIDLPSNIQRLVEIADLIDVQVFAGTRMEIYQPKVASAEELAQELVKIMQSFAASVPQTDNFTAQFIALPRINQLLVISHSEAAWTYAKRWLERIDVVAEGPGRRIFIYPVENGKATELADVLGQALGQPASAARTASPTLQTLHRAAPGGPGTGTGGRFPSQPGTMGFPGTQQPGGLYATIPAPGQPVPSVAAPPTPVPAPGQPRLPTAAAPGAKPEEQLRIVADPGTNSLIIYGTAQEFQNIKNILKELDAIPRQVLLDVLIAEVQLNNDERFGVDYEIGQGVVSIFGQTFGSRGALLSGILSKSVTSEGAVISQYPPGISGIIGNSQTVRALINALQSDSRFRVLSSPSVLASDNRPARIQVGSEEPVATGNITEAVGTVASATTIQYRNTGRIVTIIPQVNSQGLVNLQILAEVSQRGVPVLIGRDFYPAFDIRQAETTAVVQNGDTLVIGGIITDNRSNERSGIPYLMDVPVIGRFFGTTSDTIRRTELIMLITPNVIRNRQEGAAVSEEFKSKVLGLRSELERLKNARERELEKLRKVPPELPKPEPPPVPGVEAPQSESSNRPPRPPAGSAPMAPGPRSSDADQQTQPLAPRAGGENTPMATGPNLSAAHLAKAKPEEATDKVDSKRGQIWVVQVASFTKEADARFFAGKLKAKGFNPKIVSAAVDGKPRFRVEIGPLESRDDAQTVQKELVTIHKIEQAIVLTRWINADTGPQPTAAPVAP